MAEALRAKIE